MGRPLATPALVLSSRASSFMRLDRYQAAIDEAGFDGVDLDATNDLRRMFVASTSMPKTLANQAILAIWLRPLQLEGSGLAPFRDAAKISGAERLPLVVIDQPAGVDRDDAFTLQLAAASRLRAAAGSDDARIAIAIRADNREGSRDHLDRLSMVRHQVGEWDYQLALDLTTGVDGAWESEAAVLRLLPRLALVRLTVPRTLLSGGVRWRIASRAVAAASDSGFRGIYSIAPDLSLWERLSVNALADRCAMFATNLDRRSTLVRGDSLRTPGRRTIR